MVIYSAVRRSVPGICKRNLSPLRLTGLGRTGGGRQTAAMAHIQKGASVKLLTLQSFLSLIHAFQLHHQIGLSSSFTPQLRASCSRHQVCSIFLTKVISIVKFHFSTFD